MFDKAFKDAVLALKKANPNMDFVDAFIAKMDDYAKGTEEEFFDKIREIDDRLVLIRRFGNYYYQVNNGGHFQYFDNGYASEVHTGCFSKKDSDISAHEELISLVKKYFPNTEVAQKFLDLLEDFQNHVIPEECGYCNGNGYEEYDVDCPDCGGSGEIDGDTCSTCGGTGTITEEETCSECHGDGVDDSSYTYDPNEDENDDKFYHMSDDVLKLLNELCEKWLMEDNDGQLFAFAERKSKNEVNSKPKVKLVGTNGNAFAVLGKCISALKDAGKSEAEIQEFRKEATSGDYDNLLCTCAKYLEIY